MSSKAERARPVFLAMGHLAGVKRADAEHYVRGLIARHATSPEAAGFFLLRTDTGFAYEIQEGGDGRAYLPQALERLRRAPGSSVRIALANRVAEVSMSDGGPVATLLPEGESATEPLEPGPRLTPFEKDRSRLLIAAVAAFCASAAALASALAVHAMTAAQGGAGGQAPATVVDSLPVMHWPSAPEGEYVHALRFDGARWSVERRPAAGQAVESFESFSRKMERTRAR